jgi:ATP-dependent protease Clp ATPase subunit
MTSNIGANTIREGLEKGYPFEAIEIAIFDEIKNNLRPEFLNRFDAKVVFNALAPNAIINIAESELGKLADRILQDNDIELHWHKDMAIMVTNNAYDIADGARPIKRFINDMVVNKLTDAILNGEIKHGESVYIRPNPEESQDIILIQVSAKELQEIKQEEVHELTIDPDLIAKTSRTLKVPESEIVNADIGEPKKKKKKKKKDIMKKTFKLDTQVGD